MKIKLMFNDGEKKKYNAKKLYSVTINKNGIYVNTRENTTCVYPADKVKKIKIK